MSLAHKYYIKLLYNLKFQSPFFGGTQQTFSVTVETIGSGNAIKPKKFFQVPKNISSAFLEGRLVH
jgi:hypothetical protein